MKYTAHSSQYTGATAIADCRFQISDCRMAGGDVRLGAAWRLAGLILILSFCGRALAIGECGAQFLKMGAGARACAMGEAFAAVADDASAIYWNPAGLKQLAKVEVLAMQNFWLLDMSYQYAALAVPTPIGAFGLAGAYSSSGTIPRYEDFRKVGEYSAYDAAGTAAYAGRVPGFGFGVLDFGLALKYVQQQIDSFQSHGFAGDLGLLYKSPLPMVDLKVGLALQNVGPGIKFIEQADPLPLNVKVGLAVKVGSVVLAADVNKARDNSFRLNVGAEGMVLGVLALRAGYNTANSFTAGGGVTWKMVSVDYAFVPYKVVDATHRISVGMRF